MAAGDIAASFDLVDRAMGAGKDVGQLMADLTIYLRDLMRIALGSAPSAWRLAGEEGQARTKQQAHTLGVDRLLAAVNVLAEAQSSLRQSSQHALVLELTLAKLCDLPDGSAKRPGQKPVTRPAAAAQTAPPAATPTAQAAAQPTAVEAAPVQPVAQPAEAPAAADGAPPPSEATPALAPAPSRLEPPVEAPPASAATPSVAPSPEMPPAQPVTTGEVDLALVQQHWNEMEGELRRMGRMAVGAFVKEAWPEQLEGDTLSVAFRPEYAFHQGQVSGTYRDVVEQALVRLYGRPLSIRCRLAQPGEKLGPVHTPEPTPDSAAVPPSESTANEAPAPDVAVDEAPPAAEKPQTVEAADAQAVQPPPAEPNGEGKSAVDRVVRQALSLFEGSRLLGDDE